MIHEHSNWTSAIDKYWLFPLKEEAKNFYKILVRDYGINSINNDYVLEIYNNDIDSDADAIPHEYLQSMIDDPPDIIYLDDENYLVFTAIDQTGFGRRP